jgi:hypothetical protein
LKRRAAQHQTIGGLARDDESHDQLTGVLGHGDDTHALRNVQSRGQRCADVTASGRGSQT